jgi:tetrahydromethanopterin S-methyltransferase subunit C
MIDFDFMLNILKRTIGVLIVTIAITLFGIAWMKFWKHPFKDALHVEVEK